MRFVVLAVSQIVRAAPGPRLRVEIVEQMPERPALKVTSVISCACSDLAARGFPLRTFGQLQVQHEPRECVVSAGLDVRDWFALLQARTGARPLVNAPIVCVGMR
jgi:hypothetical protein